MTEQIVRAPLYDAPPVTRVKGSLLDVATIHDDMAWVGPVDVFPTYNCLVMDAVPGFCYPGQTGSVSAKDLSDAPSWVDAGTPFGVYGGVTCRPFGFEGLPALRAAFEAKEAVGVEKGLMSFLSAVPTTVTVLDPKGGNVAVTPQAAVAALEEHAACTYAGVPTLHMPRGIASLLSSTMVKFSGNALYTHLGSKVAAGGGYGCPNIGPDNGTPGAGERWLYATGEVVLWRGEVEAHEALNQTNNDLVALVERTYMVAVDCYIAAVKVNAA